MMWYRMVHAGYVKAMYQAALKAQGISIQSKTKSELKVDRGITQNSLKPWEPSYPIPGSDAYRQPAERAVLWDGYTGRDLSGGELSR